MAVAVITSILVLLHAALQGFAFVVHPSRTSPLQPRTGGAVVPRDLALQALVGTGGGRGRRGRGREGDDDGRPINMSDDKYYEAFWREQERLEKKNYESNIEEAYYDGLDKNVRFITEDENAWDGRPDRFTDISRETALRVVAGSIFGTAVAMTAQRWKLLRRYTSPGPFTHPYDAKTARRPFTRDQLRSAVRRAAASRFSGLPDAPVIGTGLKFLRGSRDRLAASLAGGKTVLYVFWRASSLDSLVALCKAEGLLRLIGGDDLEVVAIHSPKYDTEGEDATVENAIRRAELSVGARLQQNVVVDPGLSLWKDKGLDEWPTTAVGVGSANKVLFVASGERGTATPFLDDAVWSIMEVLRDRVDPDEENTSSKGQMKMITGPTYDAKADGQLREVLVAAGGGFQASPLRYPMDVAVDPSDERLYICDSGNHRIVVTESDGLYVRTIGAGRPGFQDGFGKEAQFRSPHGVTVDPIKQLLYVADTLNDRIRTVDLRDRDAVSTLRPSNLPTPDRRRDESGMVFEDLFRELQESGEDMKRTAELGEKRQFRLPVQLCVQDSYLYVAAAGSNQIWRAEPYDFSFRPLFGSGASAVRRRREPEGSDLSDQTAFAEPTGIAAIAGRLLIAEGESSTLREVDFLDQELPVKTLFGADKLFPQDLSAFGDTDGYARSVRVQHPTALCTASGNRALMADTYNHKVKLIEAPRAQQFGAADPDVSCRRVAGSGTRGFRDGPGPRAEFDEPRGLAVDPEGKYAFVCDSNNHAIRKIDISTGGVTTLTLSGFPDSS